MKKFLLSLLVISMLVPSAFAYYTKDGANIDTTGLTFEGATDDAFETSVNVTDPTADRTITIPDASVDLTQIGGSVNVLLETEIDAGSELAALLDDETGTGVVVFSTSPTLVTPTLGVASATSITTTGAIKSTSSTGVGWVVASGANTACNTTCGASKGCLFGQDSDSSNIAVDCASASADVCVCSQS